MSNVQVKWTRCHTIDTEYRIGVAGTLELTHTVYSAGGNHASVGKYHMSGNKKAVGKNQQGKGKQN